MWHIGHCIVNRPSVLQINSYSGNKRRGNPVFVNASPKPLLLELPHGYAPLSDPRRSFAAFLAACSGSGVSTEPSYSDKERETLYKHGSLISDEGGSDLFGGSSAKAQEGVGIGVNGFLWRATLDTLSFMPITSADPFGGVIITDWYSPPETPSERTRLNVFIRDRDLRADGVKVSVFRQTKAADGSWADAPVAPATSGGLERHFDPGPANPHGSKAVSISLI